MVMTALENPRSYIFSDGMKVVDRYFFTIAHESCLQTLDISSRGISLFTQAFAIVFTSPAPRASCKTISLDRASSVSTFLSASLNFSSSQKSVRKTSNPKARSMPIERGAIKVLGSRSVSHQINTPTPTPTTTSPIFQNKSHIQGGTSSFTTDLDYPNITNKTEDQSFSQQPKAQVAKITS